MRGHVSRLDDFTVLDPESTRQLLYQILSTEQQKRFEVNRQLDFSHSIPGVARFRVNVYMQRESVGAAFRVIPDQIKTLEELQLPVSLAELAQKPRGLVLVTGPTGSGKSTTLAAMIDEVNRTRHEHILTIEDPIEFVHRHKSCIVNQREIGVDAVGFGEALRGALRQDPDVILVGEMRDLETIASPSPPRRPATSCSARSTRRAPQARSTASSTSSRPSSRNKSASRSPARSRA